MTLCSSANAFAARPSTLLSTAARRKRSTAITAYASTTSTPPKSDFSDEELQRMANDFLSDLTPEKLSEDFVFRGPVIGPLCKKDFVATLTSVANKEGGDGEPGEEGGGGATLDDAFPDLNPHTFGFSVDPLEPNRVWFMMRPRGTFLGPFDHPVKGRIQPTGEKYIGPPETRSITFDANGKVRYITVGYVADRFTGDTTGGRGAVFGMYAVMGEELDDTVGSPFMIFVQWLSSVLPEGMVPKSYSKKEDLPAWWKDSRMGAEK